MKQPVVVIVDYGAGNIDSVFNALAVLGYRKVYVSCDAKVLSNADAIILPGVGAFAECIRNLKELYLDEALKDLVLVRNKPLIGICIGMQLLADYSEEGGYHRGLGLIPGEVRRFQLPRDYVVPHVGWNEIQPTRRQPLFTNLCETPDFYFDHSYHFQCPEEYVLAWCDYSSQFIAAVHNHHTFGVQFHPEKSHNNGLKLFRAFFNFASQC